MKFTKRLLPAVLCAVFACAGAQAGCAAPTYYIYTNMPEDGYTVELDNFKLGQTIGGLDLPQTEYEAEDTSSFTSKRVVGFYMMADTELVVSADFTKEGAEEDFNAFMNVVQTELLAIQSALSTSSKNSDISKFNSAAAGETLEIGGIAYNVLSEAKAVYTFTEGYYNPALYYNIIAYGFGENKAYPEKKSELPKDEDIQKYTELSSHFGETELWESEGKYFVKKPDFTVEVGGETLAMKLDLGGIGKGYAVDRVDWLLDYYGYKYGYFNFGSSSMLVKSNYRSGNYNLGFTSPRSLSREPYIITSIGGEKLSTSGDNEQYYEIGGKRYCHIISSVTGKPVEEGIMSVTVIGGSAARDDALTTAIMAMGKERAVRFIEEKLTDRRVVFTCEK